jgi:glutamine synthetase
LPAVERQLGSLNAIHGSITAASLKKLHLERVNHLQAVLEEILTNLTHLEEILDQVHGTKDETQKMRLISATAQPMALKLRGSLDSSERLVADEFWTLPKYREMLFSHQLA